MPVAPSTQFGPYRIVEHVASGGMGDVYRAVDTRLDRTVALKTLSKALSSDPLSRQRFEREARIISNLNHPNICAIYDVGEQDGVGFLVMEFVKGQPLSEELAKGPLDLPKALQIARQIADALHEAHRNSVVHRDLKPGNVMLTPTGAKLLDFGLAKTAQPVNDQTRTLAPETGSGTILGTVAYMSPEQAEGKPADVRSDIFSFGSVLYEMVTGRRAFSGSSQISILSAILRDQPTRASQVKQGLPTDLDRILSRCWRKNPDERYQNIADVKHALEDLSVEAEPPLPATEPVTRKWIWIPWALAALATTVAILVALKGEKTDDGNYRLSQITADGGLAMFPALSPDGKLVAFASDRGGGGNTDIWVRQTADSQFIRLTNDQADESSPAFSPDGSLIAFRSERAGGGIYVVSAFGGDSRLIAKGGYDPQFSPDGKYLAFTDASFSQNGWFSNSRLFIVPMTGGEPKQLVPELTHVGHPIWLNASTILAFARVNDRRLALLVSLDGGPRRETEFFEKLGNISVDSIRASNQGHALVFSTSASANAVNLWTVRINPANGRLIGEPQKLTFGSANERDPSIADTGAVAFASMSKSIGLWQMPLKVDAALERADTDVMPKFFPAISGDSRYLAYSSLRNGAMQICVRDLVTGTERVLTSGPGRFSWPAFLGHNRIVYAGNGSANAYEVFSIPLQGGLPEKICSRCGRFDDISADARFLLTHGQKEGTIVLYDRQNSAPSVILAPRQNYQLFQPHFSANNEWVTFVSKSSPDDSQIFAARIDGGKAIPESEWIPLTEAKGGNDKPRLSPDDRSLYFTSSRDGYRCIYVLPLDATMHPAGPIQAFKHLHSSRRSMSAVALTNQEISVSKDKIVFNLADVTGEIWLLTPEPLPATR